MSCNPYSKGTNAVVLVAFELRDSGVIECFMAHAHMYFNLERLETDALQIRYGPDGVAIYRLHLRGEAGRRKTNTGE